MTIPQKLLLYVHRGVFTAHWSGKQAEERCFSHQCDIRPFSARPYANLPHWFCENNCSLKSGKLQNWSWIDGTLQGRATPEVNTALATGSPPVGVPGFLQSVTDVLNRQIKTESVKLEISWNWSIFHRNSVFRRKRKVCLGDNVSRGLLMRWNTRTSLHKYSPAPQACHSGR